MTAAPTRFRGTRRNGDNGEHEGRHRHYQSRKLAHQFLLRDICSGASRPPGRAAGGGVHPTFNADHNKEFRQADGGSKVAITKRLKAAPI
jgi:hypothetical protein